MSFVLSGCSRSGLVRFLTTLRTSIGLITDRKVRSWCERRSSGFWDVKRGFEADEVQGWN